MCSRLLSRLRIPILLIVYCLLNFNSDFRGMSSVVALGASVICSKIPGLAPAQRHMCQANPSIIVAIGDGARLGITECQVQFQHRRWNCTANGNDTVFGHVIVVVEGTREAAYIYSITAAGITHAITQACNQGNISNCSCDRSSVGGYSIVDGWKWGGCSADVLFGMRYARKFLDAREIEGDARSLMNVHNNRAGRKAVKDNLLTECKCHGVSGSCTMKTCWKTLSSFRQIGTHLMKKYLSTKEVVVIKGTRTRRPQFLKLRRSKRPHRKPRRRDLVFLHESPNYCERDHMKGSLGTVGRTCNRSSMGTDGCDLMCCGRGYNTHHYVRAKQCNCKFHWCCSVECDLCAEGLEEYTCK